MTIIQAIRGVTDIRFSPDGKTNDTMDVIILDHLPLHSLDRVLADHQERKSTYINNVRSGLRPDYEQIKEICALRDIPFLVDHADQGIQEEIEAFLFPDRYVDKIQPSMSLVSCHRGSGANSIAMAVAEEVARRTTAHIAVVRMDPYHVTAQTEGIFQLYKEYDAGGLTPMRIKEVAQKKGQLYIIGGNTKMDCSRALHPDKLEQILGLIQSTFDLTLFVVCPYWDNPLTLVTLKTVKRKYLVATSKDDEMKEFYAYMPQIRYLFNVDLRQQSFVYNFEGAGKESKLDVSAQLQAANVLSIPFIPGANPLMSKFTRKGIEKFGSKLIDDYQMPVVEAEKRKKNIFAAAASLVSSK